MPDKRLQLKTPLKNILLNLNGDRNSATGAEELSVSLGRSREYFFDRIVFTWSKVDDCYISARDGDCTLWVGRACFDVRAQDIDLITTTFGIRVDRHVAEQSAQLQSSN